MILFGKHLATCNPLRLELSGLPHEDAETSLTSGIPQDQDIPHIVLHAGAAAGNQPLLALCRLTADRWHRQWNPASVGHNPLGRAQVGHNPLGQAL